VAAEIPIRTTTVGYPFEAAAMRWPIWPKGE